MKLSIKGIDKNRILVNSFWFYADALVLAQQIDKDIVWLLNNYINVQADKTGWAGFWTHGIDCMGILTDCPFFDFQRINKSLCTCGKSKNIIDFIKMQINDGSTPIVMVDSVRP